MTSLARSRAERAPLRSRVSKLNGSLFNEDNVQIIEQNFNKINVLASRLQELDIIVRDLIPDDSFATEYAKETEEIEKYDNMIMKMLAFCKQKMASSQQTAPPTASQSAYKPHFKSPSCPLPEYNDTLGSLSLLKFLDDFKNVIKRYEFSDFELFCLLKKQIKGRPLQLLDALPPKDQSFDKAEALLKEAFASPNTLKFESIQRLLKFRKPTDPYSFATEMRLIQEEIEFHKVSMSDVMQFCFLRNMPDSIKASLIQLTNSSYPTLDQISENIFLAIERSGANNSCKSVHGHS